MRKKKKINKGPNFDSAGAKTKAEKNLFKSQLCALQWFEKLLEIAHFPGE